MRALTTTVYVLTLGALVVLPGCAKQQPQHPTRPKAKPDPLYDTVPWIYASEQPVDPPADRTRNYAARAVCLNCGWTGRVEVPRGQPVNTAACPRCATWRDATAGQKPHRSYLMSAVRADLIGGQAFATRVGDAALDALPTQ